MHGILSNKYGKVDTWHKSWRQETRTFAFCRKHHYLRWKPPYTNHWYVTSLFVNHFCLCILHVTLVYPDTSIINRDRQKKIIGPPWELFNILKQLQISGKIQNHILLCLSHWQNTDGYKCPTNVLLLAMSKVVAPRFWATRAFRLISQSPSITTNALPFTTSELIPEPLHSTVEVIFTSRYCVWKSENNKWFDMVRKIYCHLPDKTLGKKLHSYDSESKHNII